MNPPSPQRLRDLACHAVQRLQSAGFIAYWAGGCVRDQVMGRPPKDYDIATSATPDQIAGLFPDSVMVGKSFGVVRAPLDGIFMEVATFRRDLSYSDGRHPNEVLFTDPVTDAQRRDFTINAMFFDPVANQLHDYVGGQKDIDARVIRFVGEATERVQEDHLRLFRAVRFSTTLDFALDPTTIHAIRANAGLAARLSPERIRDELTRTFLESRLAGQSLVMLDELGLLEVVLPEVVAMKGQAQPPVFHPEGDVFTHTVLMLDRMESRSQNLVLAVLLHDIAKPVTARLTAERIRFDGHAEQGAEMAKAIMRRLRFANDDVETVAQCILNHMKMLSVLQMRQSTLRRLVGAPTFPLDLELHRLDCLASHGDLTHYQFLADFSRRMAAEPVLPPPWVTGRDIIALGVPEGPAVGVWRCQAYDAQLEGRFSTREELLKSLADDIRHAGRSD